MAKRVMLIEREQCVPIVPNPLALAGQGSELVGLKHSRPF